MRVGRVVALLGSAVLSWTGAPRADEPARSLALDWSAPVGCPSAAEVIARSERLVGHSLAPVAGAERLELATQVERLGNGEWVLHFSSRGGAAPDRSVSAATCDELADAAALWIALAIDPSYAARQSGANPAPSASASVAPAASASAPASAEPPPLPAPPPSAPPAPPSPPARTEPIVVHWALAARGDVWLERLPGVAPGGGIAGSVWLDSVTLGLSLAAYPPKHGTSPAGGGDVWLGTAGATLGYSLWAGALTPVVGLELDRLHGSGQGFAQTRNGTTFLLAADAGLVARYTLRRPLRIFIQNLLSVPLERPKFTVSSASGTFLVHQPGRVGDLFGLGAELELD